MTSPLSSQRRRMRGMTLVELLMAVVLVVMLVAVSAGSYSWVRLRAGIHTAVGNLRHLCVANHAYAADHDGWFCPAQEPTNRIRWHGGRKGLKDKFDQSKGFLAPYITDDTALETCPLLRNLTEDKSSFERGAGGYGYNAAYIGGQPGDAFAPACLSQISALSTTVMFATTAIAKKDGLQEYPFVEPYYWITDNGERGGDLQPSLHFRAGGKAIVAWADGHVTLESPIKEWRMTNFYSGNNKEQRVGFFGPDAENGYWNPRSEASTGRTEAAEEEEKSSSERSGNGE